MSLPKWICYRSSHHTSSHKRVLLSIVYSSLSLDCCLAQVRIQKTRFQVCLCQKSAGRGHGMSEPRSVGVLANAHGMTLLLQRTKTPEPQLHLCFADGSSAKVFWSPSGTFCPKARGLSPQHIWEQAPCVFAAWPCFSCPQRNLWSEMQPPNTAQSYNVKVPMPLPKWTCYQSSHHTSSHKRVLLSIVYSTVCLLIIGFAQLRIQKTQFEVCLCQPSVGRGHGKSEPRSVGVLANAHGMTLLLQRTKTPEPQLHLCFADGSSAKVFRSPSGTFCPKARGLSPQHLGASSLCVRCVAMLFLPSKKSVKWNVTSKYCAKLQRQSSNATAKMNLLPIQPSYKQPQARPAFNCV